MIQFTACTALTLLAATPLATALDSLSAVELHEHCVAYANDSASESARLCEAYIRGFVAGLTIANRGDEAPNDSSSESFSDRALRTRLGAAALQRAQCAMEAATPEEIVRRLLAYAADDPPRGATTAAEFVGAALRRFQICGEL
jgi:hypothetical protein